MTQYTHAKFVEELDTRTYRQDFNEARQKSGIASNYEFILFWFRTHASELPKMDWKVQQYALLDEVIALGALYKDLIPDNKDPNSLEWKMRGFIETCDGQWRDKPFSNSNVAGLAHLTLNRLRLFDYEAKQKK